VQSGSGSLALVAASLAELAEVNEVDVVGRQFLWILSGALSAQKVKILCKVAYRDNPDWTVVAFDRSLTPFVWKGQLVKQNRSESIPATAQTDRTVAHSGKQSLKITTDLTLKQDLLQLESGKSYLVNVWVSVNNPQLTEARLGENLGITLTFKNKQGTTLQTAPFAPAGRVMEGWQQLSGEFVCPAQAATVEVTFRKGNQAAVWFDDLRLHPVAGNMQSYVYDPASYRLMATLDENNFAAFYYYDEEGRLYLTKKETEEGVKTIAETVTHVPGK
jgi:hypothetical protein